MLDFLVILAPKFLRLFLTPSPREDPIEDFLIVGEFPVDLVVSEFGEALEMGEFSGCGEGFGGLFCFGEVSFSGKPEPQGCVYRFGPFGFGVAVGKHSGSVKIGSRFHHGADAARAHRVTG